MDETYLELRGDLVPVPIRRSSFVHVLGMRRDRLNVETDLSKIRTFDKLRQHHKRQAIAFCDVQLDVFNGAPGRLGAGRAVYYDGHYIKGCGRTPLAMNWNTPDMSSGHLPSTRALREYFFSRVAIEEGLGDCLVPCESVRLKKADPALFLGKVADGDFALDSRFQALSIKAGRFVRPSNLAYLLASLALRPRTREGPHLPGVVDRFLTLLYHALDSDLGDAALAAPNPKRLDWEKVFRRFAETTLARILKATFGGLYLGSFPNNVTLQGRFLDLELAMFTGGPAVGVVAPIHGAGLVADSRAIPFQPALLRQIYEMFFRWLEAQLRCLRSISFVDEATRRRLGEVLSGCAALRNTWILDRRAFVAACLDHCETSGTEPQVTDSIRRIAHHAVGLRCRGKRVELHLASPMPAVGVTETPSWLYVLGAPPSARDHDAIEGRLARAARARTLDEVATACNR